MELERVTQPLEGWIGFVRTDFVELFKKLFRVNLYAFGTVLLAVLVGGGLVAGAILMKAGLLSLFVGILAAVVFVVLGIAAMLFSLAAYKVVDEEHGAKRKVDIPGVAMQKAVPAIIYGIILLAIYAGVLIPFGLVGLAVAILSGGVAGAVMPIVQLGMSLTSLLVGFFLQFALFELVLADKGPLESMRASFGLAKRNFWETVVFFIVRAVVSWIVSIPFVLLLVVVVVILIIIGVGGGVVSAIAGGAQVFIVGMIILLVLVFIPYALAFKSANETAVLSLTYRYWRTIRGDIKLKPSAAPATAAPSQTAATPLKSMPPSQSRAVMATVQSPVMVAPVAGPIATVRAATMAKPQVPRAAEKKPAPKSGMPKVVKKAPPRKPAAKKAQANKKHSLK